MSVDVLHSNTEALVTTKSGSCVITPETHHAAPTLALNHIAAFCLPVSDPLIAVYQLGKGSTVNYGNRNVILLMVAVPCDKVDFTGEPKSVRLENVSRGWIGQRNSEYDAHCGCLHALIVDNSLEFVKNFIRFVFKHQRVKVIIPQIISPFCA
jgi:hypothetical protein